MKKLIFTYLLSFGLSIGFAQKSDILKIDSLPKEGVLLDKGWKWHAGDNPAFAKADFDDSAWESIDPTKEITELPQIFDAQIKWLRFRFEIKNKLPNPLGIAINQAGASEIYLNGHLIHQFGHFDTDSTKVKAFDPLQESIYIPADSIGQYILAIRYAIQPNIRYTNIFAMTKNRLFHATILNLVSAYKAKSNFKNYYWGLEIFIVGVVFMLFVLHLAFYIYQKNNKTHLILAIYFLGTTIIRFFKIIGQSQHSVEDRYLSLNIANWTLGMAIVCLAIVFYRVAKARLDVYFYIIVIFQFMYSLVSSVSYDAMLQTRLLMIGNIISFFVLVRLVRMGFRKKIKGFFTLGAAIFIAILGLTLISGAFLFLNHGVSPNGYNTLKYGFSPYFVDAFFAFSSVTIPIGLSLFMGIQGSETNKELSRQLIENNVLKNKAIEHEQEKQHILEHQNELLEKLVEERTLELNKSLETLKATQSQLIQSEKLASLGELTAGIAHEIQNPLNFVNNFSELSVELVEELKSPLTPEGEIRDGQNMDMELFDDVVQNLEKIHLHGKRASSIVKGMLEHSRASTDIKELADINKLADEYLRLSYHGLRAKNKDFNSGFELIIGENLPKIEVIPQDLGRVFLNLFNNAFYAVNVRQVSNLSERVKPLVIVSTERADNQVIIKVKDNGTGMSEATKAKIFQPFFTTKPTGEGTGLGLSLAYDIITKGHGGVMEVESVEGEGSTFTIKLPLNIA